MLQKPLEKITSKDVDVFVSQTRLQESASLDYKRDYDFKTSKEEFLEDVCAMANFGGGHILVGVDELIDSDGKKTGYPEKRPRGAKAFQKEVAEDTLHNRIEPKVGSQVEIQSIEGGWDDGPVFVVRVGFTGNSPHCITKGKRRTFYKRSGTKSEPMDINQIRDAFIQSSSITSVLEAFHKERVRKIQDDQLTYRLEQSPGVVLLHVVPIGFFSSGQHLSLHSTPNLLPPGGGSSFGMINNFDGKISFAGDISPNGDGIYSYVQLFRNGVFEALETGLVYKPRNSEELAVGALRVEASALKSLVQASTFFSSSTELEGPYILLLSVFGVGGTFIPPPDAFGRHGIHRIEHNHLLFPHLRVDTLRDEDSYPHMMRPLFDMLWQSSGWAGSRSFDRESGAYTQIWR